MRAPVQAQIVRVLTKITILKNDETLIDLFFVVADLNLI